MLLPVLAFALTTELSMFGRCRKFPGNLYHSLIFRFSNPKTTATRSCCCSCAEHAGGEGEDAGQDMGRSPRGGPGCGSISTQCVGARGGDHRGAATRAAAGAGWRAASSAGTRRVNRAGDEGGHGRPVAGSAQEAGHTGARPPAQVPPRPHAFAPAPRAHAVNAGSCMTTSATDAGRAAQRAQVPALGPLDHRLRKMRRATPAALVLRQVQLRQARGRHPEHGRGRAPQRPRGLQVRAARAACLATGTRGGGGGGGGGRGGGVAARTEDEASSACNLNI